LASPASTPLRSLTCVERSVQRERKGSAKKKRMRCCSCRRKNGRRLELWATHLGHHLGHGRLGREAKRAQRLRRGHGDQRGKPDLEDKHVVTPWDCRSLRAPSPLRPTIFAQMKKGVEPFSRGALMSARERRELYDQRKNHGCVFRFFEKTAQSARTALAALRMLPQIGGRAFIPYRPRPKSLRF
jgi:hypothetical protein